MAERTVYAELTFDDDKAIKENDMEEVEYLEREFGWLQQSGISLEQLVIIDTDCDDWDRYLNYLFQWAFGNISENAPESPLSFNVWKSRKDMRNEK